MAKIDRDLPPADYPDCIVREFESGEKTSWAVYSQCENYRYRLRRYWDEGTRLAFLMLNPSTATELKNDPTVERCERRARNLGYGGFEVINIFALRSTDPKGLYTSNDPVGTLNDNAIIDAIENCDTVLCAWGNHGALNDRGDHVRAIISTTDRPLLQLGITKIGQPKHPLYVSYATNPEPFL